MSSPFENSQSNTRQCLNSPMRALLMGSFVSKQAISRFDGKILEGDLIYFLAFSNRFNFEVKKIEKFKNLRIQTPNFDSDSCI